MSDKRDVTALMFPWTKHEGLTCVECPKCGFCFDEDHEDMGGGYSCPACAEIELREALTDLLRWAHQCPTFSQVDLLPGWWVRGERIRKRAEGLR